LIVALACLAWLPRAATAQTAIIQGRVTVAPAGRAAAAADVRIEGTTLVAVTDTAAWPGAWRCTISGCRRPSPADRKTWSSVTHSEAATGAAAPAPLTPRQGQGTRRSGASRCGGANPRLRCAPPAAGKAANRPK